MAVNQGAENLDTKSDQLKATKPSEGSPKQPLDPEVKQGLDIINSNRDADTFNPEGALIKLAMEDWGKQESQTKQTDEGALINSAMADWNKQGSEKADTANPKSTPATEPAPGEQAKSGPQQAVEGGLKVVGVDKDKGEEIQPQQNVGDKRDAANDANYYKEKSQDQPAKIEQPEKESTPEDKLELAKQQLDTARHGYAEAGYGVKGKINMAIGTDAALDATKNYNDALKDYKQTSMEQLREKLQSDPAMNEKDAETGKSPAETLVENTMRDLTAGEFLRLQDDETAIRAERAENGNIAEKAKNMAMNMIDSYRKLDWKKKLGIGLAVGIGGGAVAGTSAIIGRRIFGGIVSSVGFKESAEAVATKMRDKRMETKVQEGMQEAKGESGQIDLDKIDAFLNKQSDSMADKFQNYKTMKGLRTAGSVAAAVGISLVSRTAARYLANTEAGHGIKDSIKDKMHDFANKDTWSNIGEKARDMAGKLIPFSSAEASPLETPAADTQSDVSHVDRGNQVPGHHMDNLPESHGKTPDILKSGGGTEPAAHVVEAVKVEKDDTLTSIFKKGLLGEAGLNDAQQENFVQNLLHNSEVKKILAEAGINDPDLIKPGQEIPLDKINAALGDKLQDLRDHAQGLGVHHETPGSVTSENTKAGENGPLAHVESPKATHTSYIDRGNQVPGVPTENIPGFHKAEIPEILKTLETHHAEGQTVELRPETHATEAQPDILKAPPTADTQPTILRAPPVAAEITTVQQTEVNTQETDKEGLGVEPQETQVEISPTADENTTVPQVETATQEKVEQQEVPVVETTQTEEVVQEKVVPQEAPAETTPAEQLRVKDEIQKLLGKHTPDIFSQHEVDVPKNHDFKVVGDAKGIRVEDDGDMEHVVMKSEAVKEAAETIVPQSWLKSINSIQFESHDLKTPELYGKSANVNAFASSNGSGNIEFYRDASSGNYGIKGILGDTLIHEAAHENDWEFSDILDPAERANLLSQVLERVQSEDRFKSSHVEGITSPDKQFELYAKTKEYWGEISEAYFNGDPELSYDDSRLVEDYIKKDNPNFDIEEARAKINALGSNSEKGHAH